ncbi:MAG: VTT domain-containing protein [Candidatus Woesearchaeota archaeon]|jgi:membrane protein YqaA with SNARE-associated domain|nr:VTT domain-containing protein [Candidatus Woesearchaeota archaeon]
MKKEDENYYIEFEEDEKTIELPYHFERTKTKNSINQKKSSKKLKWIIILSLAFVLYLFYDQIMLYFLSMLQKNPTFYKQYLYVQSNIVNQTLIGLFFSSIFGAIFFLVLPSEALFIYFLNSTQYFPVLIIVIMICGNITGLLFNYLFGRMLGERVLRWMFKKNFESYKEKVLRYGGVILFVGNIFPGPIEVLSVFYGGFKFSFARYIFLAFMGRLLKYVILFLLFIFFWDQIINYYDSFFKLFEQLI